VVRFGASAPCQLPNEQISYWIVRLGQKCLAVANIIVYDVSVKKVLLNRPWNGRQWLVHGQKISKHLRSKDSCRFAIFTIVKIVN
jgi:hypothetical protein